MFIIDKYKNYNFATLKLSIFDILHFLSSRVVSELGCQDHVDIRLWKIQCLGNFYEFQRVPRHYERVIVWHRPEGARSSSESSESSELQSSLGILDVVILELHGCGSFPSRCSSPAET